MNLFEENTSISFDPGEVVFKMLYKDIYRYLKKRRNILFTIVLTGILILISFFYEKYELKYELMGLFILVFIGLIISYFSLDFSIRIKKIGIFYLPISLYPYKDKAILIDRSRMLPSYQLTYPYLHPEEIENVNTTFEELKLLIKKFTPVLHDNQSREIALQNDRVYQQPLKIYGQEHEFILNLEKLLEIFENLKIKQVEQSFIPPEYDLIPSLRKINQKLNEGILIENVSKSTIESDLNIIEGIINKRDNRENAYLNIDNIIESILQFLAFTIPRHHWSVSHSIKEVKAKNLFRFMNNISFYSFNFYCPKCNEDILRRFYARQVNFTGSTEEAPVNFPSTTKMKLINTENGIWECQLCKHKTDQPITIHRMEDELFRKVFDKLYEENKNDRLKIYYDIINQKRSYIEKAESQLHDIIRENRSKKEQLKSKIRTISADVRANSETIQSLYTIMAKYDRISQQRISEFEAEITEIEESIMQETQKHLAELEYIFENVQSEISQKLTEYANLEKIEQKARDEIQAKQLKALEGLHGIEAARGEREKLYERSNWNPFNWGYNIRKSVIKSAYKITGKDEVSTAKKLHNHE